MTTTTFTEPGYRAEITYGWMIARRREGGFAMRKLTYVLTIPMLLMFSSCSQRTTGAADRSAVQVPSTAAPGVIPAGTEIAVRTNETIDTDQPLTGRTFDAQVTRPIMGSGNELLVPEGSSARLRVIRMADPGAVGTGELSLAVDSMTVRGRTYNVETMAVDVQGEQGLGANRRTATMVGGGAALGTLIGAIAGGGSGAAIGAAVGAAGGATTQVLTRGDRIRVPAETVLTFRTNDPLRLSGFNQ
jgi:hypothetical protein